MPTTTHRALPGMLAALATNCMCTFACTLDCEFDACAGDAPSAACLDCLDLDCQPQYDDCLADN